MAGCSSCGGKTRRPLWGGRGTPVQQPTRAPSSTPPSTTPSGNGRDKIDGMRYGK